MNVMTTRIQADHVLTYQDGHHALLAHGEVVVAGDTIVAVGPRSAEHPRDERVIELGASILLPGFIDLDAVADIDHAVYDSCWGAEQARGLVWSREWFEHRRRDILTPDQRAFVRRYAFAQLLLHGVTTAMPIAAETHSAWAETYDDAVAMADAAAEFGLRAYLGPSYRGGVHIEDPVRRASVGWCPELGRSGLDDAVRFVSYLRDRANPLLQPVLLPCRIETLDEELLRATARESRQLGVKVRLHALQGVFEWEELARRCGRSPVQLLCETGLLGQDLLLPHAVYVDSSTYLGGRGFADVTALAEAGVTIIHCPLTSARYGVALQSFRSYRDAGVAIAMGTDSFPPDLIRGMDYGVNLAKIIDGRLDAAPASWYLDAATLGGARALGRDDLGRLSVGAQADMIAFAMDDLRDGPMADPVRTLLSNGCARNLRLSMIAGRVVVRDGEIPGADTEQLRAEAQTILDTCLAGYTERDIHRRGLDDLFPPSYPAWRAP